MATLDYIIEVRGDREAIAKLSRLERFELDRLVRAATKDIGKFAAQRARHYAPFRTGHLAASISEESNITAGPHSFASRVSIGKTAHYGVFVDQGTGLFGARHSLIKPRSAPFMVWLSPTHGLTHAKTTKGQPGQHFMLKAYETTRNAYVPARLAFLEAEIKAALEH